MYDAVDQDVAALPGSTTGPVAWNFRSVPNLIGASVP